jgi:hypothetical protein
MAALKKLAGIYIFTLLISFNGYGQSANTILGRWKMEEKGKAVQMEIYLAKDGKYYSRVINDSSRQSLNGKLLMKELQYDSSLKQYKGTMSPPDAGIEINVTVSLLNNDRIKMVGKKLIMTKTFYLARIK